MQRDGAYKWLAAGAPESVGPPARQNNEFAAGTGQPRLSGGGSSRAADALLAEGLPAGAGPHVASMWIPTEHEKYGVGE